LSISPLGKAPLMRVAARRHSTPVAGLLPAVDWLCARVINLGAQGPLKSPGLLNLALSTNRPVCERRQIVKSRSPIMATQHTPAVADGTEALMHTTHIVVSYVANNTIGAEQIASLMRKIHETLQGLGTNNKVVPRP